MSVSGADRNPGCTMRLIFCSLSSCRRAMKRTARPRCPFRKGTCEITQKTRRQCQACRLRKCLESGMRKESEQRLRERAWACEPRCAREHASVRAHTGRRQPEVPCLSWRDWRSVFSILCSWRPDSLWLGSYSTPLSCACMIGFVPFIGVLVN